MTNPYPYLIDGESSPQSLFVVSATKKHPLGTAAYTPDGRGFRYAKMIDGTAIGPNQLAQCVVPEAAHVTETGALTGLGVADTSDRYKPVTAVLGSAAAYVNEYEDGILKIQSATTTGAGQAFSIPGHAAVLSAGILSFSTTDLIVTAVAGTVTWSLVHNPWAGVIIQPVAVTCAAAGVPLVNWPAATSAAPNYGWLQTSGLCSILKDDSTLVAGHSVGNENNNVAGTIAVSVHGDIVQRVGISMAAMATDAVYAEVFLQIAP